MINDDHDDDDDDDDDDDQTEGKPSDRPIDYWNYLHKW